MPIVIAVVLSHQTDQFQIACPKRAVAMARRGRGGIWKGGGGGGDARRKFWIKPLKETDLVVAQAFFDP